MVDCITNKETKQDLNRRFAQWPQTSTKHHDIQAATLRLAQVLMDSCENPSHELVYALNKLEECRMWADKGVR